MSTLSCYSYLHHGPPLRLNQKLRVTNKQKLITIKNSNCDWHYTNTVAEFECLAYVLRRLINTESEYFMLQYHPGVSQLGTRKSR